MPTGFSKKNHSVGSDASATETSNMLPSSLITKLLPAPSFRSFDWFLILLMVFDCPNLYILVTGRWDVYMIGGRREIKEQVLVGSNYTKEKNYKLNGV